MLLHYRKQILGQLFAKKKTDNPNTKETFCL